MNRVFIRGDTHGNFDFLEYFCQDNQTTIDDVLIILGDAGINYYGCTKAKEKYLKQHLAKQPIMLLCVRGNHEDRPEDRPNMNLTYCDIGDPVYTEDEYPNLWYAMDGGEYNICGKKFLTIGGAYSIDKFYRIAMGWKWVANEMLDVTERAAILDKVYRKSYDYVCTHTCPIEWEPTDLFLGGIDQNSVPKDMERFLTDVKRYIEYEEWYFGHYHADRPQGENGFLMFEEIKQLI